MRLICFWCALVATLVSQVQAQAQSQAADDSFYEPQTFRNHDRRGPVLFAPDAMIRPWEYAAAAPGTIESYQRGLFTPSARQDYTPQSSQIEPWRQQEQRESWAGPGPISAPLLPKPEPWRAPLQLTKEQQANIIHHKQALTSEGSFRFEYASDNGLAAGETIEPDGTRIGAYQYKDPSGQIVKLKYKAGKEGFQILEGSHLPKSPEPVQPQAADNHYQQAYEQQRRQYELQQQYNQQKNEGPQNWGGPQRIPQNEAGSKPAAAGQFYTNWRSNDQEDDGQYRENEVEAANNRGPHNFGEGYTFAFQG